MTNLTDAASSLVRAEVAARDARTAYEAAYEAFQEARRTKGSAMAALRRSESNLIAAQIAHQYAVESL